MRYILLILLILSLPSCSVLDCGMVVNKVYEPSREYRSFNPALKILEWNYVPERFGVELRGVYQGDTVTEYAYLQLLEWVRVKEGDTICLR